MIITNKHLVVVSAILFMNTAFSMQHGEINQITRAELILRNFCYPNHEEAQQKVDVLLNIQSTGSRWLKSKREEKVATGKELTQEFNYGMQRFEEDLEIVMDKIIPLHPQGCDIALFILEHHHPLMNFDQLTSFITLGQKNHINVQESKWETQLNSIKEKYPLLEDMLKKIDPTINMQTEQPVTILATLHFLAYKNGYKIIENDEGHINQVKMYIQEAEKLLFKDINGKELAKFCLKHYEILMTAEQKTLFEKAGKK